MLVGVLFFNFDFCQRKVTDAKSLSNQVDILVYQLTESESTRGSKPGLDISAKINEVHLENIRRECERKKWTEEKNLVVAESREIKLHLNEHLTSNYTGAALQLYAQYLGSYLTVGLV